MHLAHNIHIDHIAASCHLAVNLCSPGPSWSGRSKPTKPRCCEQREERMENSGHRVTSC